MIAALLILALALASLLTFGVFAYDKLRAKVGGRRVPEITLHAFSGLGGAAGGLAAMLLLRHKTRKGVFWLVNVGACAVHALLVLAALLLG
ncbi:MAG: DUF1294 domain-containing protein [Phycisphaerales bacterium]|nr:DUF1294 domain-containing protein [Phycisphaerales bacterium]